MVCPSALFLDTLGCGFCFWVELLSPAVMSHDTSLPYFMMLILACGFIESYGLASIVM
jgi:hypothetical protein